LNGNNLAFCAWY